MKFINKLKKQLIAVLFCTAMVFLVSGCGKKNVTIPDSYKLSSDIFGILHTEIDEIAENHLMSNGICVANENT